MVGPKTAHKKRLTGLSKHADIMQVRTVGIHELLRKIGEATWLKAWTTTSVLTNKLKIDY